MRKSVGCLVHLIVGGFQIDERRCSAFRLLSQVGAGLPDPNSGKRRE